MRNAESDIQIHESNELLNGSDIKMKEFDRVGSEDDILEDYSDDCSCNVKGKCLKKRTSLEIVLLLVVFTSLVIIVALAIALGTKSPPPGNNECQSPGCIAAANSILSSMDQRASPCRDFYQYACGGWIKDNPAPPGYSTWDRFQQLSYTNLYRLKNLLETRTMLLDSEKKAKSFYQSCMTESKLTRRKTLTDFSNFLHNITMSDVMGSIPTLLEHVNKHNSWPLFQILVGVDERNPNKNLVKIDIGKIKYPLGAESVEPSTSPDPSSNTTYPTTTKPPQRATAESKYLKWNFTEVEKNYLRQTTRILKVLFNHTDTEANINATSLLQLEKSIAGSYEDRDNMYNQSFTYNRMSITELEQLCGTQYLHWHTYLQTLASNVNHTGDVIVLHKDALVKICRVVDDYMSHPEKKKIMKLYLLVHLVESLMPYFESDTFEKDIDFDLELENDGEHWRRCVHYTNKAMGFVTGAIYINGLKKRSSINKLKELVQDVKAAFKDYLLRKIWLDDNTKHEAALKLDEMLEKISYPDYILNSHFLDTYYEKLNVGEDWFTTVIEWQQFKSSSMFMQLNRKPDRSSWINPPITVESDYSAVRNDIMFPIAMFHLPFYSYDGPPALNFGAIGSVIGHEITHAFDIQGRQYDGKGQLREWWEPVTEESFYKTTKCMKQQYDEYTLQGFPINGAKTLDENIADNGGLRAAYIAYQLWERKHSKEPSLPGINMTNKQLFFVSYAQMFCSKWKTEGLIGHLIEDTHSPGPIRVRGSISNTESFSEVFNCPIRATNYNPRLKCEVW